MKEIINRFSILFDDSYLEKIIHRKACIEELISDLEGQLKKAPAGSLRVVDKKSYVQYFLRSEAKDTNGTYIPKEKLNLIRALAQKENNGKVLKLAKKEEKIITKYAQFIENESYQKIYDKEHIARKQVINPIQVDIDEYIKKWKSEEYEPMGFTTNTEFYSNKGVRVRSKSELIIANLLEQYEIPYKYEKPIQLRGLGIVRPDFICLNKRERKEYVWEHFGMMDNGEYANKNISKVNMYQQNGYFLGENMIASFETSQQPISSRNIKSLIEQYLQ